MAHPVIHAEIRSADPDATREFFADRSDGGRVRRCLPGLHVHRHGRRERHLRRDQPLQGAEDEVLFFVGVDDVDAALRRAEELGGTIVQPAQHVPGTSFGVFADAQGHKVGVAASGS